MSFWATFNEVCLEFTRVRDKQEARSSFLLASWWPVPAWLKTLRAGKLNVVCLGWRGG